MPLLRCDCGNEQSVSPGRMIVLGETGQWCARCGARLQVRAAQPAGIGGVAADDEDDIDFAPWTDDAAETEDAPHGAAEQNESAPCAPPAKGGTGGGPDSFRSEDCRNPPRLALAGGAMEEPSADAELLEPVVVAADPPLTIDAEPHVGWRQQAWGVAWSSAVHAAVLALLWFVVAPTLTGRERIEVQLNSQWTPHDEFTSDRDAAAEAADFTTSNTISTLASPAAALRSDSEAFVAPVLSSSALATLRSPSLIAPAPPPPVPSTSDLAQQFRPLRKSDPRSGGVVTKGDTGSALDGILGHLRAEVKDNPLQVIWLMDMSLSLHVDRQEIAARLVPFYQEMIARPDRKEHPLRSVVLGYGARPVVLQDNTDNVASVTNAIAGMSSDPSGLENVFTAVQFALSKYGRFKGTTVVVIWTDESGDDLPLLEDTIAMCRKHQAVVHVVGPQAVLGMEWGLQKYTLPGTNESYMLPVKRGPDAALPERLLIPYWFDSVNPPWTLNGAYIGDGSNTGPYRANIMSGVGPYALTRLALQTGGTFTLLLRPGDPPPMRWDTMRNYLPDYDRADEIIAGMERSPLRKAVVEAASITWTAKLLFPTRALFDTPIVIYPFGSFAGYTPPEAYLPMLRARLPELMAHAERDLAVIETALTHLDPTVIGDAYDQERMPRWRAWYDLNAGRLLATSVRLAEYRAALEPLREGAGLTPKTNRIELVASSSFKAGRVSQGRAELAKKHLQRVISDHPDTPWATLARAELQYEFGFAARLQEIPPPRPPTGGVAPPTPKPYTPSLPKL